MSTLPSQEIRKPRRQAIAGTVPDQVAQHPAALGGPRRSLGAVGRYMELNLFPLVPGKLCTAMLCVLMVFPSYPQV